MIVKLTKKYSVEVDEVKERSYMKDYCVLCKKNLNNTLEKYFQKGNFCDNCNAKCNVYARSMKNFKKIYENTRDWQKSR